MEILRDDNFYPAITLPLWLTVVIGLLILLGIVWLTKKSGRWALDNMVSWKPKSKLSKCIFYGMTFLMWVVALICLFSLYVYVVMSPVTVE